MNKVIIRGSYGCLHCDRDSGAVLKYVPDTDCTDYADIVRFNFTGPDVASLDRFKEGDILDFGFWTSAGEYVEPMRADKPEPLPATVVDVGTVSEYGLTQKLSAAVRCF